MTDIDQRQYSASSVRILHTPEAPASQKDKLYSWVVCFACFIVQVVTVGILNSFGVIFVELREEFKVSKAELSWIASLAFGMSLGLGPLAGAFRMRFGTRVAICCGGIACGTSLLSSSFAPNTKTLFGTFSLLYAIGGGLVINSTTILAPDYFDRYIALATGIVVSGGSFGTLLFSYLGEIWVESVGWRRTFQIYSGFSIMTIIAGLIIRPVQRNQPKITVVNTNSIQTPPTKVKLWQNRVFDVWVLAITFGMFGYYIPYVHLISYAVDIGISKEKGSVIIMVLGGTSAMARLLFGKILSFQFLNKRQIYQISMMVTATSTMMVPISTSMGALVVYAMVQGLSDGCNVVLVPLLTRIYAGDSKVPMAWGILNGVSSITFTLGPPVAGFLADATGSYNVSFHVAGIPLIASSAVLFFIPWAQSTTQQTPPFSQQVEVQPSQTDSDAHTNNETQVIAGLPVTDIALSTSTLRENSSRESRLVHHLPTESEILNESRWSWASQHQNSSIEIEIPASPVEEIELHKTSSVRGIELQVSKQESDSDFEFVNKPDNSENYTNMDTTMLNCEKSVTEDVSRPENLNCYTNPIVEALVELNEPAEDQPVVADNLLEINGPRGMNPFVEDTMQTNLTPEINEDESSQPSGETQGLVIPDYVVEKLVELNESEQNRTNSDAAVETLVNLSDDEDVDAMPIASGSNRIVEHEGCSLAENTEEKPHQQSSMSRQPSESQCIIPSSVVETLANLAQQTSDPEQQVNTLNNDNPMIQRAGIPDSKSFTPENANNPWETQQHISTPEVATWTYMAQPNFETGNMDPHVTNDQQMSWTETQTYTSTGVSQSRSGNQQAVDEPTNSWVEVSQAALTADSWVAPDLSIPTVSNTETWCPTVNAVTNGFETSRPPWAGNSQTHTTSENWLQSELHTSNSNNQPGAWNATQHTQFSGENWISPERRVSGNVPVPDNSQLTSEPWATNGAYYSTNIHHDGVISGTIQQDSHQTVVANSNVPSIESGGNHTFGEDQSKRFQVDPSSIAGWQNQQNNPQLLGHFETKSSDNIKNVPTFPSVNMRSDFSLSSPPESLPIENWLNAEASNTIKQTVLASDQQLNPSCSKMPSNDWRTENKGIVKSDTVSHEVGEKNWGLSETDKGESPARQHFADDNSIQIPATNEQCSEVSSSNVITEHLSTKSIENLEQFWCNKQSGDTEPENAHDI